MTNTTSRAALLGATLLLAACGGGERPAGYAPALPPAPPILGAAAANGSIFQAGGYAPLHVGARARQVGDLVTVVLTERTSTNKSARASTNREGGISLTPPSSGPFSFDGAALNSSGSASFNGLGDAAQSSSLRGDITVTIAEVRPNGTALIVGEKLMQLSQGEEWIQLSGIIRLADVDPDNRIASPRIADASITYGGKGAIQQSSKPGWLNRFFNLVSPF
jgi:flagellar L-ring protein precursor FlgH